MAPDPDLKKLYKRDPYHSYFGSDTLRFPVDPLPPEGDLRLKDRLVLVRVDDADFGFPLAQLASLAGAERGTVTVMAGQQPLEIAFDNALGTAFVEPTDDPSRLQSVRHAFWFATYALEGIIPVIISRAGEDRRHNSTTNS
jgi:hypothetical protein